MFKLLKFFYCKWSKSRSGCSQSVWWPAAHSPLLQECGEEGHQDAKKMCTWWKRSMEYVCQTSTHELKMRRQDWFGGSPHVYLCTFILSDFFWSHSSKSHVAKIEENTNNIQTTIVTVLIFLELSNMENQSICVSVVFIVVWHFYEVLWKIPINSIHSVVVIWLSFGFGLSQYFDNVFLTSYRWSFHIIYLETQ